MTQAPEFGVRRPAVAPEVAAARLWRGFAVGLVLIPPNVAWVLWMEHIGAHGPILSTISLFFNVVFILFFVGLGNTLVRRVAPRQALTQGELIVVYVMLTIATSLAGLDGMQVLLPVMTHGFWFATPENRWAEMMTHVPSWLFVSNLDVLYGYYNGSSTLYQRPVLQAWVPPALWWTGFIVVLVFVMVCLSVIVRSQWSDRERLTFPIIQLPMALTEPGMPLLRNKLLWIGLLVAGSVDLINGLHYLYPALPYLSVAPVMDSYDKNDLTKYLTDMPWKAVGWLPVTFYPAVIGLCFLLPVDLLFSCLAFFVYWKVLFITAAALGLSQGWSDQSKFVFPYANEQMFGGYLGIALGPLLVGRRYFKNIWYKIRGRPSEVDDAREGMSYRFAVIGVVVGIGLLVAFSMHAGLPISLSTVFFALYYFLALAVARVRAEFGSPVHDFHHSGPDNAITYIMGTENLTQGELGVLATYWWFNRAYRGHPIANSLEGLQMSSRARLNSRKMAAAIMAATLVATVAIFWIWLHYAYIMGAGSKWNGGDWRGVEMCDKLQTWTQTPTQPNFAGLAAIGLGFGITMLLGAARAAFVGWPLHPVAYAISASWSIHLVWMPMLLALIAKALVLRYGGLRMYRQALPLFFGLILGETIVGCGWTFVGLLTGIPNYSFWGL
jgi:hypothetical protein